MKTNENKINENKDQLKRQINKWINRVIEEIVRKCHLIHPLKNKQRETKEKMNR